jgi:hypothetical protein
MTEFAIGQMTMWDSGAIWMSFRNFWSWTLLLVAGFTSLLRLKGKMIKTYDTGLGIGDSGSLDLTSAQ